MLLVLFVFLAHLREVLAHLLACQGLDLQEEAILLVDHVRHRLCTLTAVEYEFIVGSVEAVACLLVGDSAFESIVTQEWHKTTLEHTSMLLPPYDLV